MPYADQLGAYGPDVVSTINDTSDIIGGKALEVEVKKSRFAYDAGVTLALSKDIKQGDVLYFTFFAKALAPPAGQEVLTIQGVGAQQSSPPYHSLFTNNVELSTRWQSFSYAGTANKDYPVGNLQATFQIATGDQEIAFGPVFVFNVGK